MFEDLKVGDQVFVVPQSRRYGSREGRYMKVTKIGRLYGYLEGGSVDESFFLSSGISHHKEANARVNGFGFDVYRSEQDYLSKTEAASELDRLEKRLLAQHGFRQLTHLPAEVVSKIHAILDEHEGTTG